MATTALKFYTLKFLEDIRVRLFSRFAEEAAWRMENASWHRWSRQRAVTPIGNVQPNWLKKPISQFVLA